MPCGTRIFQYRSDLGYAMRHTQFPVSVGFRLCTWGAFHLKGYQLDGIAPINVVAVGLCQWCTPHVCSITHWFFDWLTTSIGTLPIYNWLGDPLHLLKSIRSSLVFVALMIMLFWLEHVWAVSASFSNVSEAESLLICMMFVSSNNFEYWHTNSRSFICSTIDWNPI